MGCTLKPNELLQAWERSLAEPPIRRALNLLATADPDLTYEQLQLLPIGQRDGRLIALRETLFGSLMTCLIACPQCGERLEITLDSGQFQALPSISAAQDVHTLSSGQYEIKFRLPNSVDMQAIADLPEPDQARRELFEHCVKEVTCDGALLATVDVPEEILGVTASEMAVLDPLADIQIEMVCPACSRQWMAAFDIVSYLWDEINAWATRTLHEVHQLASAYGWREADILALSPMRRQFYLEMIG